MQQKSTLMIGAATPDNEASTQSLLVGITAGVELGEALEEEQRRGSPSSRRHGQVALTWLDGCAVRGLQQRSRGNAVAVR
jgi:hypothetical protein